MRFPGVHAPDNVFIRQHVYAMKQDFGEFISLFSRVHTLEVERIVCGDIGH